MTNPDRRTLLRATAIGGLAAAAAPALGLAGTARADAPAPRADTAPPAYLTDVRAPVRTETTESRLHVEGTIPPELTGRYLRNGPNPHPGVDTGLWWSGAGMLHGIRLRRGRAEWYRNRWIRTEPGAPGPRPDLHAGAANTSIRHHAGSLYALYEVSFPYRVTPDLETVGPVDFGGRLTTAFTAHPKVDPATGAMHFFGYSMAPPFATYHRLDASGALVRSVPIDLPEPIMMHDFAITDRHVVWLDLPVVWAGPNGEHEDFPVFSDRHRPRIGVMPMDGTSADIRWFDVGPRWAFHVANAHTDAAGRIVVEAVTGDAANWAGISRYFRGVAGARGAGRLYRWILDPATGRVTEHELDDIDTEFPSVSDDLVGRPQRYLYTTTTPLSPTRDNRVIKLDTRTGAVRAHHLGPDRVAGEAVFVPAPGARREDDGWLLTILHDLPRGASALAVLDASAPDRRPVAVVHLPRRVPYGFHGTWVPDTALGA